MREKSARYIGARRVTTIELYVERSFSLSFLEKKKKKERNARRFDYFLESFMNMYAKLVSGQASVDDKLARDEIHSEE